MLPNTSADSVAQGSLFDAPMTAHHADARRYDPITSWLAAFANPVSRSKLRVRVFGLLSSAGAEGMTDAELAEVMPDQHPGSVSKRRCDLVRAGLVVRTSRTRPTRFGQPAIVWAAAVHVWEGPPAEFCGCSTPEPIDRWCRACALPYLPAIIHWSAA